jgi:ABC-2 type transport system permease protein
MHPVLRLVVRNFVSTLDRITLFFNLIFPIFFIFILGFGYTGIVPDFDLGGATVSYPVFLAAGAVAFTVVNSGTTAGGLLWLDRKNGMLGQILMGPFTRGQYLAGMIVSTVLIGLVSAAIVLVIALPVLAGTTASLTGFLVAGVDLALGSLFFGSMALALSVRLKSSEAFQIVSTFIFFIVLFTSSVFYPAEAAPAAIQAISLANPLTFVTDILRAGLLGIVTPLFAFKFIALVGASVAMFVFAVRMFRNVRA